MALSKGKKVDPLEGGVRLVLVGKTGVGKSALGNTILGKNIFESKASASSVSLKAVTHKSENFYRTLQVIDTPGFVNTILSQDEMSNEMMKCIGPNGTDVILHVVQAGQFILDDIKRIRERFGEESRKFMIVIFTKLDYMKRQGIDLEDYLREGPKALLAFLAKIENRYLGVDNWSNEAEKDCFVRKLLTMVRTLVEANDGRRYTNEMYQTPSRNLEDYETTKLENLGTEMKYTCDQGRLAEKLSPIVAVQ